MNLVDCQWCANADPKAYCLRCHDSGEVCADCLNDPDKTDCECREPRDGAFPCAGGDYGPDVMDGHRRLK